MYFCSSRSLARSLRTYAKRVALFRRTMASIEQWQSSHLVAVRSLEEEDHMNLIFVLKGKYHNLLRLKDEPLGKTLKRIIITAAKPEKIKRSLRKHVNTDSIPIEAHLVDGLSGQQAVPEDIPNVQAWVKGRVLVLDGVRYTIEVNLPTVVSLKMPRFVLSGCPAVPEVETEFTDSYSCKWTWKRYPVTSDPTEPLLGASLLPVVGNDIVYWPSEDDVDHRLLVECVPISPDGTRTGIQSTVISPVVMAAPTANPIVRRHLLTPAHLAAPDQFRVVTYNTLAEPFTASPHAHEQLYPYCDPSALDIDYRQCLIVHELLGYNTDVFCLQEVDHKTFNRFLLPALRDKGYDGCHCPKSGMIKEGEAIFFDTSKFSLMSVESTSLNDFFESDPSCSELYQGLQTAPYFLREVLKKHNIVLTVFLRSLEMPDTYLCVVNTHLYYHPMGDHIRLIQVATALNFLKTKMDKFLQLVGQQAKVATIIGGDFNSCPCIAAYDYVLSGNVSRNHPDWMVYKLTEIPKCACDSKQLKGEDSSASSDEGEEEDGEPQNTERDDDLDVLGPLRPLQPSDLLKIPKRRLSTVDDFRGLDLKHEFHFQNATGTKHYTNYTLGYRGVLDYIFFDSDILAVERVVPLPSHSEVTEFVALPSVYFPSDHLALVVDLRWK